MFRIYTNGKLKTSDTPFLIESMGGLACTIYNPIKPHNRSVLAIVTYRDSTREPVSENFTLQIDPDGLARIPLPEFAIASYVEVAGIPYYVGADYENLQPGEYYYNPFTEILTLRPMIAASFPVKGVGVHRGFIGAFGTASASTISEQKAFIIAAGSGQVVIPATGSQTEFIKGIGVENYLANHYGQIAINTTNAAVVSDTGIGTQLLGNSSGAAIAKLSGIGSHALIGSPGSAIISVIGNGAQTLGNGSGYGIVGSASLALMSGDGNVSLVSDPADNLLLMESI